MKNDSILIVGSGALATFFAARLAASGQAVTMLGSWPEGLRALSDQGACLSYADDQPNTCFRVRVVDSPAACQGTHWALVFVKAWQTARAAAQLAACLASDGLALSLQNGLGNREILADTLGLARVAVGSTTLGARIISPGVVRPAGEGIITLPRNPKLNPLIHILKTADFLLEARVDLDAALWQKVAINAAINPLAALLE